MRFLVCLLSASSLFAQAKSEWAHLGDDHRLHYKTDARGNRIMDFSAAGYRAGGVALPTVPVAKRLMPVAGDNTAQIQAALDQARGAVVLAPGEYEIAGTLTIARSSVVLRGEKGATIRLTGRPHRFLEIRGSGTYRTEGAESAILDDYVPSGADTFRVRDAASFHTGERVLVQHPVTAEWVHFMGMDTLVRDGKPQTWIRAGNVIRTDRAIKSVSGDRVTLDVPLSDSLDAKFTAATLIHYSFPGRITEAGVENLKIVAPFDDVPITGPQFTALRIDAAEDVWARDIEVQETQNGVVIGPTAKRVTLANVRIRHSAAHSGSAAPADFALQGTQILLDRCAVSGTEGTWPVVTQAQVTGPIVVLNFTADHRGVAPHQRWATALLVDGGNFPGASERTAGIAFTNRTTMGSGHGWDIGWAVAWNVRSPFLVVQQPPGTMNWCIGCVGKPVTSKTGPDGIFDSTGTPVEPASLYLEQLRERLGAEAVKNIGY
jgi:hypothetical protein